MEANNKKLSYVKSLELYIFLSSLAVNFFFGVVIVINKLSIRYFFYATQMTIHITILSPFEDMLVWIGSTWLLYAAKETTKRLPSFSLISKFIKVALVGSYLLVSSIVLGRVFPVEIGAGDKLFFAQIQFLIESAGALLLFTGCIIALFASLFRKKDILTLFFFYLFSILIPIEIWALIHWVAYPFNPILYEGLGWQGAFIELQLFYTVYPLVFWLFMAFLFSWVWAPAIKYATTKIRLGWKLRFIAWLRDRSEEKITSSNCIAKEYSKINNDGNSVKSSITSFVPKVILTVSLLLGAFASYYPNISFRFGFVGWDMLGYYELLTRMANEGLYPALQLAFGTDRPGYFLLLYFLKSGTSLSPYVVIELMPRVTILANVIAVFWFVKIEKNNALIASLSAILTVFSFNTTIAMYTGILANWFAMALGFIFFGMFLKAQENKSKKHLFAAIFVSAMILLVHYWTGIIFLLIAGCCGFLSLLEKIKKNKTRLIVIGISLASVVVLAFFLSDASLYFLASYGGFTENLSQFGAFGLFWTKLQSFIDYWFYGTLANPVMLSMALLGIILAFNKRTAFNRLLISWVIIVSLSSIFIAPIGTNINQWLMWRAIYLIPFQIPAAFGLYFLLSKLKLLVHTGENIKSNGIDTQHSRFFRLARNENYQILSLILIDYAFLALLLIFDFNVFLVLFLLNYLVLTVFIRFKIHKRDNTNIILFLFTIMVILLLFNYTLRSLAPLTLT